MVDSNRADSLSGLTEGEAQEFHRFYMQGFLIFTAIAVVAHILVWMWRPWIPGPDGYAQSMIDGVKVAATSLVNLV
ncbi:MULTISPECIES: light-harvesting antenna LH1, beta subunit [Thalassobaculum]|uniref:Light-harvesting complex 1 beta chain n=1 Tax=Thalassobaculum litoreum DSM 18839 TaxID=1123362 RepID=A0A8G2F1S8_9PROT|nr:MULTISPECIES: light-harvesting antenna LH1, beta subunit [Thalassobaculum]WPZ36812.1 light-harvesting antenna LH1, beta subunit [Thalassobaculum sp. OXR-137]SDF26748.1 light-harvesting complex 1 beta chain [Thalassobaculum litoreum DSM 18839]